MFFRIGLFLGNFFHLTRSIGWHTFRKSIPLGLEEIGHEKQLGSGGFFQMTNFR